MIVLQVIQPIIAIIVTFIIPGFCIAHIVHAKRKVPLDMWEYINIASASSLVIVPLLLLGENVLIGKIFSWLPLLNTILLFTAACYLGYKKRIPNFHEITQPIWVMAFGIFGLIIALISTAYGALPESDPYYWLQQYRSVIPTGIFYNQDRPLFYALSFLFVGASHVDLYTYFKYVLPFLSIFTIAPAILAAQQYKSYAIRLVILSIPFFAPSTLLYSQIPFPQAISITLMYYFFFWLLYSRKKKTTFFYTGAGLLLLISCLYHEIGIILFIIWLIVTTIHYHSYIIEYVRRNILLIPLTALLVLISGSFIRRMGFHIWTWIKYTFHTGRMNWKFPAEYINIDGRVVGWGDTAGVTKYYLYYIGPTLLFIIIYCTYLLARNRDYRIAIWRNITKYPEVQIISIIGALFFTFSEILPRFSGTALLPERMWIIGSIFLSAITLSIVVFHQNKHRIVVAAGVLLCVCISLSASLYINTLKKYVIPAYQLHSAVWIKKNLPYDRIIVVGSHEPILRIHAASQTIVIENKLYCSDVVQDPGTLFGTINEQRPKQSLYVYYAKDDERNPYLNRPYAQKDSACERISFSKFPKQYEEIYNANNQVIIWKIK